MGYPRNKFPAAAGITVWNSYGAEALIDEPLLTAKVQILTIFCFLSIIQITEHYSGDDQTVVYCHSISVSSFGFAVDLMLARHQQIIFDSIRNKKDASCFKNCALIIFVSNKKSKVY